MSGIVSLCLQARQSRSGAADGISQLQASWSALAQKRRGAPSAPSGVQFGSPAGSSAVMIPRSGM